MVITATGKTFPCDYVATIPNPPLLYFRVLNASLVDAVAAFSSPTETAELRFDKNVVLTGYTAFVSIAQEGDAYKICLKRDGNG